MIDFGAAKLLELASFFLIGGGWLAWQLWETRDTRKPDTQAAAEPDAGPPPA
jgi:hypothetical protein